MKYLLAKELLIADEEMLICRRRLQLLKALTEIVGEIDEEEMPDRSWINELLDEYSDVASREKVIAKLNSLKSRCE